ncbi:MAG: hypothetical protein ACE5GY_05290 [Thermodesulfobacteriota bacterium]
MPKYTCLKCNHDFWGWGVPYQFTRGGHIVCPECDGILVEAKPESECAKDNDMFDGTAA